MEEADDHVDLFGDEDDTDHFFLPEHYVHNEDDVGATNPFDLFAAAAAPPPAAGPKIAHDNDADSLASDGLDDDEALPEEEEATNPAEDFDYEDLIAQAQKNVERGPDDRGADVKIPDFGGLPAGANGAMARWMAGVQRSDDAEEEEEEDEGLDDSVSKAAILREYYPSFQKNAMLNFSDLFSAKKVQFHSSSSREVRQCVPNKIRLEIESDNANAFRSSTRRKRKFGDDEGRGIVLVEDVSAATTGALNSELVGKSEDDAERDNVDLIMACSDWEKIIESSTLRSENSNHQKSLEIVAPKLQFLEGDFDCWGGESLFDGILRAETVTLDMNDPQLFLSEEQQTQKVVPKKTKQAGTRRYDFSNDEAYAMLQETHQSRVRSNLTQLTLEHAFFSDRLQSPYYRTLLSKSEARAYHRPSMIFKPNQELRFSRVKPRKKKDKDRVKDPKVLLQTTKDISLADNSGFVCLEYSEEYPTILSNVGMGSKIINYYRKRNEEDEYRPSANYGEPSILGSSDRSPFWNFGSVEPGETTQTIYNKLYRAPVFKHAPASTDFLLVKCSTKLGNRFYLRNMKHIFTVGQTLPVVDIPGPHSRKVTTSYKNRLKMITYRLIRKNEQGRLLVRDLIKHFPDQNELQIRQRLKDFMEFQRKGEDQNFWKLKSGDILPSEEATRAMIDPETVCLIEAMQVGQRHLEDSGYGKSAEADDDQDDNMTTEQQLAPWIATRNFINATQGKAMLQLYGEGDPTGRGEGYSFIRTSMKGGFKVAGESVHDTLENEKPIPKGAHAYNVAKQQKAYEDEISRIWNAQKTSLSMTNDQVLDTEALENNGDFEAESPYADRSDVPQTPSVNGSDHDDDMMSMNSAMSASSLNKVLKIQRVTRDEHGNKVITTEIVKDPHVIHAYVQKRRLMEEDDLNIDSGSMERTNDEEKNKRMKKKLEDELARLRRNAERRRVRKIQKEAGLIKSKKKTA